jgi:hypothetical protein
VNVHDDMSDAEVLTAARDRLSGMPVGSPPDVKAVMARGRARRRRRRLIPGLTGTLAVAAGAALAVTALTSATHQASRHPAVHLAAWTVTKLADGNISISVSVRELADPAGLQSTLRADGVPASVTIFPKLNPACLAYPGGKLALQHFVPPLLMRVFPTPYDGLAASMSQAQHLTPAQRREDLLETERGQRAAAHPLPRKAEPVPARSPAPPVIPAPSTIWIVIDPSALPANAGVLLVPYRFGLAGPTVGSLLPMVVYASPECTGS